MTSQNALRPARPMVIIDHVCWNEMDIGDELTLLEIASLRSSAQADEGEAT